MAFEEVGGACTYPKYKELNAGDLVAQGHYESQFISKFEKPVYVVRTDSGAKIGLNSCGSLDYVFKQLKLGDYVQVIYTGVEKGVKTKYGVKDINTFKVSKDPAKSFASAPVAEVASNQFAAPPPSAQDDDVAF